MNYNDSPEKDMWDEVRKNLPKKKSPNFVSNIIAVVVGIIFILGVLVFNGIIKL